MSYHHWNRKQHPEQNDSWARCCACNQTYLKMFMLRIWTYPVNVKEQAYLCPHCQARLDDEGISYEEVKE